MGRHRRVFGQHIGVAFPIGIVYLCNDGRKLLICTQTIIETDRVKHIIKIPGGGDHDDRFNGSVHGVL